MPITKAQCPNCGGALEVDPSKEAAVCPFCNTPYIVEKAITNYVTNVTNNIQAQSVNIINQTPEKDFEILAGELKKYLGASANVIIPDNVTSIDSNAFASSNIVSVKIPSSVKTICSSAFSCCDKLETIDFPEEMQSIAWKAFSYCTSLKSVKLPKHLKRLCNNAFSGCYQLTDIAFPDPPFEIASMVGDYPYLLDMSDEFYSKYPDYKGPKSNKSGGCYVATCVYGSYDCPQVWTLRRYRDNTLAETWYGRAFIKTYYGISPALVKWFGNTEWFKKMWQIKLDRIVAKLQANGVESTPYIDKKW